MAAALADIARANGARSVAANTLPIETSSARVLRRNGFQFAGAVEDPEDGLVWAWRKRLA